MSVSQKCQYALRAVLELAKRHGQGPTTSAEIAVAQAIPPRFLELILGDLRRGGFVQSRRGARGGYLLAMLPAAVKVGGIIRFTDGPVTPVRCLTPGQGRDGPLYGDCALTDLWSRARDAVAQVYDETTFQDLIDQERRTTKVRAASYDI